MSPLCEVNLHSRLIRVAVLLLGLLSLCFPLGYAQHLQVRGVMQSDVTDPLGGRAADTLTFTLYYNGARIRVDSEIELGKRSLIADRASGKMYMIEHYAKAYHEQSFVPPAAKMDSAQQQAARAISGFKETSDTLTINGYKTKRFLLEMPFDSMPDTPTRRILIVWERWIAPGQLLADAFALMQSAGAATRGETQSAALSALNHMGLPLRSTMLVVNLPGRGAYNLDNILRAGLVAEGIQMRVFTEIKEVQVAKLDPALFEVPTGYTKR